MPGAPRAKDPPPPLLPENNATKHFGLSGALAGFKVLPAFRGGRLPVFRRLLLLITANRGELVTCQIAQSHANTPPASLIARSLWGPSAPPPLPALSAAQPQPGPGGLAAGYRPPRRNDG